ncbi:MAG: TetR/AcrR family transcriptional regulator, partial [Paracoccaceae bacterium]
MTEPDPRADRIIAAGKARFASDGFEKTRLSDVARDAGVAVGTIYLRHPGKTELLVAVLSSVEQGFVAAMEDP